MRHLVLFVIALIGGSSVAQISPQCQTDVDLYNAALGLLEPWALKMLDSSTKIPEGYLWGHVIQMGNFDECISADSGTFIGKYCSALLLFHSDNDTLKSILPVDLTLPMKYATCQPSSCTTDDINQLLNSRLDNLFSNILPDVNVTSVLNDIDCTFNGDTEPLGVGFWIFVVVVGLLVCAMVVNTVLEIVGFNQEVVKAFSALNTADNLVSAPRGNLGSLDGLRALSILWVIMGHRFESTSRVSINNYFQVEEIYRKPINQVVIHATLAVDTFFYLSGFLVCYVFFREMQKRKKFNLLQYYIYRYLRLTVPMIFVIWFYASVFTHIGNGPLWKMFVPALSEPCRTLWWQNILYINNYVGYAPTGCLSHAWYLAADMQLSWLAPIMLLPLFYTKKVGSQIMVVLILVSCALPFAVTYVNDFPWSMDLVNTNFDPERYAREMYFPTHQRATPYFVGILAAYVLHEVQQKKFKLHWAIVVGGWFVCIATIMTVIFTLAIPYQEGYIPDRLSAAFYASLSRLAWSVALSWIVIICSLRRDFLDRALSFTPFRVISNLTYSAYLIHIVIIGLDLGQIRTPLTYAFYPIFHAFMGDVPVVFAAACALHFLVEAPLMFFMRMLFKRGQQAHKAHKPTHKNERQRSGHHQSEHHSNN